VSAPKSGTITDLNKDTGSLVYTPGDGFTGQDRFTFKASDGTTDSNTAPVTVKAPIEKNQVTATEPVDKNQDATVGKKTNGPKEIPRQDPQGTTGIISQDISRDDG
jgi:hypothetical protein